MSHLTEPAYLQHLLQRHGFRFSKALGQNFLIDASIPRRIAESAFIDKECGVLEIGPGIGCLTEELALQAGKVLSVELDRSLRPLLEETVGDKQNVEVLFGDILKLDLKALVLEKLPQKTRLVCANLPYNITTPVLTKLIETGLFDRICVMIQREVAQRICADEGSREGGAFGLYVQYYYYPEMLFSVPPHCFVPQPKVTSAVIRLTKRFNPSAQAADEELMFRIIRGAFNQRRKTLVNAMSAAFPETDRSQWSEILEICGIDTNIRGEKLNLGDFARISNEFHTRKANNL